MNKAYGAATPTTRHAEREAFEKWYTGAAFNYSRDPIGSRDCSLQWVAWQAGRAALLAEIKAGSSILGWRGERVYYLPEG